MGAKSIIDIELNGAQQFERFQQYFQKYQDVLAKTPKAWREVAQSQGASAETGDRLAAAMLAQGRVLHEISSTEEKRAGTLHNTVQMWQKLSGYGASFAKSVLSTSGEVLKWSALIAGGLAAGSAFGLDRMAQGVSSDRQSAMGFGMKVGDLRAFRSNFDRLVNPDAFLSWITQMETDPSKATAFYAMGGGAPTGDTQADATRMLKAIWSKSQTTPQNVLAPLLQAYGYQGAPEDLMRMRGTSAGEFGSLVRGYGQDRGRADVTNSAAWQNLDTRFKSNWTAISSSFETKVGELAPVLGKLSDGLTHLVTTVIDSPVIEDGVKRFSAWIDDAATALESGDFQKKVDELFSETGSIASSFRAFAADLAEVMPDIKRILHFIAHPFGGDGYAPPATSQSAAPDLSDAGRREVMAARRAYLVNSGGYGARFANNADWTKASYSDLLTKLEKAHGLPRGFLARQWQAESNGDLSGKAVSSAGALGAFQFMPKTAAGLGIDPSNDLDAAVGAAITDQRLSKKYGGNLRKILAAYNWGEGNLDADVKRYGKGWESHVPDETQRYIAKQLPASGGVLSIVVRNDTGGSAVVSASQLAAAQ